MPLRNAAQRGHVIPGILLREVFPLAPFLPKAGPLSCVEVGGNIGLWMEAFFHVFGEKTGSYQVYEPLPENMKRLKQAVRGLGPQGGCVALIPLCAGDREAEVTLHHEPGISTLASVPLPEVTLVGGRRHVNAHSLLVRQETLDSRIAAPTDLVKIDTEGHEWAVLQGAEGAIRSGLVRNVTFEFGVHQNALGQSFRQFFEFFRDQGWSVHRQIARGHFFGHGRIDRPRWFDETRDQQFMILASRDGPRADYSGPPVLRDYDWRERLIVEMLFRLTGVRA